MFRTELVARTHPAPRTWTLELPMVYETWAGETIVVPPKFITDLASIPAIVRPLVPHNHRERRPAVLHDYLFVIQDRALEVVNRLMIEAMIDNEADWWPRTAIAAGLAIGSRTPWERNAMLIEQDRAAFLQSHGLAA